MQNRSCNKSDSAGSVSREVFRRLYKANTQRPRVCGLSRRLNRSLDFVTCVIGVLYFTHTNTQRCGVLVRIVTVGAVTDILWLWRAIHI